MNRMLAEIPVRNPNIPSSPARYMISTMRGNEYPLKCRMPGI
jgi:hypothetical protein